MSGDEDNPLLITPPPGLTAPSSAAPAPAEAAPSEAEEFITLPPGIADSATHRVAMHRIVPPRTTPAADAEIVFFPVVPGMPAAPPALASLGQVPLSSLPLSSVPISSLPLSSVPLSSLPIEGPDDETRARLPRRVPATRWNVVLPTGQSVPVASAMIIGRDPVANTSWPAAGLLPVLDPAKSLSKTHAMLEIDGDILWVHDLDSTNGVFVAAPGLDVVQVEPGTRVMVPDGAEVELGQFIVTAIRA